MCCHNPGSTNYLVPSCWWTKEYLKRTHNVGILLGQKRVLFSGSFSTSQTNNVLQSQDVSALTG